MGASNDASPRRASFTFEDTAAAGSRRRVYLTFPRFWRPPCTPSSPAWRPRRHLRRASSLVGIAGPSWRGRVYLTNFPVSVPILHCPRLPDKFSGFGAHPASSSASWSAGARVQVRQREAEPRRPPCTAYRWAAPWACVINSLVLGAYPAIVGLEELKCARPSRSPSPLGAQGTSEND